MFKKCKRAFRFVCSIQSSVNGATTVAKVSLYLSIVGLVIVRVRCITKGLKLSIADFTLNCDTLKLTISCQLLTITKKIKRAVTKL